MELEDVYPVVRDAIARCRDLDPGVIRMDSRLVEELGMESLDFVELIFELEQALEITVPVGNLDQQIAEAMGDDAFEEDGTLTPAGRARMTAMVAGLAPVPDDVAISTYDVPLLLTVHSVCALVMQEKLKQTHGAG